MFSNLIGKRVLVVEDDFLQAHDMSLSFERQGCDVVGPYPSLEEGLVAFDHAAVDFAILDIKLGTNLVFQLADILMLHKIPFVFVSGQDPSIIPERFSHIQCLLKPLALDELETAIDMEIAQHATRH